MKRFLGLFFFAAFFSLTAAAETSNLPAIKPASFTETAEVFKETKCTVTVSYPSATGNTLITISVTTTCENCTQQAACNAAYAILSIVIPD